MVADKFTELQKAVGPEITKTDLVPAFQVTKSWKFWFGAIHYYSGGLNTALNTLNGPNFLVVE